MAELLHQFITQSALQTPDAVALRHKKVTITYTELNDRVNAFASSLRQFDLQPQDRVAIYLPKTPEAVISFFSCSVNGIIFVPINPQLKPLQVKHILNDSGAKLLISSKSRINGLKTVLEQCLDLKQIISTDKIIELAPNSPPVNLWCETPPNSIQPYDGSSQDVASILYTSGSTGPAKGVVLSQKNMASGAKSVAEYLKNTAEDRILAVLPFSFDYGLSQLTTAFSVGASVTLIDYLLPRDVVNTIARDKITGLAAVPPLWHSLSELDWSEASQSLRYITNSGGAMTASLTHKLKQHLPNTDFFWMYGLTEAFRSTYLPPDELINKPDSMGIAIPRATLNVVRNDGTECEPNEVGELVHSGELVSLGYWNNPEKTAARFRPASDLKDNTESGMAVWSGDLVRRDKEGFFYFVSRNDEMIKTSGYRVSPGEIEQQLIDNNFVREVVAFGVPHPSLGQAIVIVASSDEDEDNLLLICKQQFANYMQPQKIIKMDSIPRNANGKLDRSTLSKQFKDIFSL